MGRNNFFARDARKVSDNTTPLVQKEHSKDVQSIPYYMSPSRLRSNTGPATYGSTVVNDKELRTPTHDGGKNVASMKTFQNPRQKGSDDGKDLISTHHTSSPLHGTPPRHPEPSIKVNVEQHENHGMHTKLIAMPAMIPKTGLTSANETFEDAKNHTLLDMETIDENQEVAPSVKSPSVSKPSHRRCHSYDTNSTEKSFHRRHSSSVPSRRQDSDLEALKKTLLLRQRQCGQFSPRVAKVYNLIGNFHFRGREYELAMDAYENAISCEKGAKAPVDYSPIASAFGNLATVHRSMGDGERSSMCLERALTLHVFIARGQQQDPNKSIEVADCLYQVGLTQILRKLHQKALDTLSHCREMRENLLGKEHVDVARTIDAIGKAYLGLEKYEEAMSFHREALELKKRSGLNKGNSGYLVSLKNIAEVHEAREAISESIGVYLKVNRIQVSQLARIRMNQTHKDPGMTRLVLETGETLLKLKELYSSNGDDAESINRGREAALYFKEAGVSDDDTRMLSCWARGNGVWNSV